MAAPPHAGDRWADWLRKRRFGSSTTTQATIEPELVAIRERLLQAAHIAAGDVVLDIGCGEGFVTFEALERAGDSGRAIFCDLSSELLDECRREADQRSVSGRCEFLQASTEDLQAIASSTVDVVTGRSVMMYVADKPAAFRELHRVLRPGGRFSLFDPIRSFRHPEPEGRLRGYDVSAVWDVASPLRRRLDLIAANPAFDFDERDLFRLAHEAGFAEVHLTYEADVAPGALLPETWESFLDRASNPCFPTIRELLDELLTVGEAERFERHVRPQVEAGRGHSRYASAYLSGRKS
jgi:arsenite methyltransferase